MNTEAKSISDAGANTAGPARRDFNCEQAILAVDLAHLLCLAVLGEPPSRWVDRANETLAAYQASRAAERAYVRGLDNAKALGNG